MGGRGGSSGRSGGKIIFPIGKNVTYFKIVSAGRDENKDIIYKTVKSTGQTFVENGRIYAAERTGRYWNITDTETGLRMTRDYEHTTLKAARSAVSTIDWTGREDKNTARMRDAVQKSLWREKKKHN